MSQQDNFIQVVMATIKRCLEDSKKKYSLIRRNTLETFGNIVNKTPLYSPQNPTKRSGEFLK